MTQNRSAAVMASRVEVHDSLDDFPTPPWATRALCEVLFSERWARRTDSCREPAANRGHMVRPLGEYFGTVDASDVHDYGVGLPVRDYLFGPIPDAVHWTVTNPPFRLAERFIERALESSANGVAMLVRTSFLEGVGRHQRLFSEVPPALVLQFTERVVIHKGKLAPKGSTATAYCWMVWLVGFCVETRLRWIPPCRARLEREGDYA